jgi:DNA polymerase-1
MPQAIKRVSTAEDACAKAREYIGIDTETALSTEANACPPLACYTVFSPRHNLHAIYDRMQAPGAFEQTLRACLAEGITAVANHLPYDFVEMMNEAPHLIPLVFEILDLGLAECTLLREKLDDIARARYDKKGKQRWHDLGDGRKPYTYALAESLLLRCGIILNKDDDTYRQRFGEFVGLPISSFPQAAVDYALDDPKAHWLLARKQDADEEAEAAGPGYYVFANAPAQTRMGVCLQLMRARGINTDATHTLRLKQSLKERANKVQDDLIRQGFLRAGYMRPKAKTWVEPSKDTKLIKSAIIKACAYLGQQVKMTFKNDRNQPVWLSPSDISDDQLTKVSMDAEQLEALEAAPSLFSLVEWNKVDKLIGYTTILETGFTHPIHSEPNTLVENGRISWGSDSPDGAASAKSVNLTNLPTERGVRECYIPTKGNLFFAVDYSQLELCAVAQVCLWLLHRSRLAELINEGIDLHCMLGSMFMTAMGQPITYEEFYARYKAGDEYITDVIRDAAKKANFGFWGGMGIDRFMTQHRELKLPRATVELLKHTWLTLFPEARDYFKLCGLIEETSGSIVQFISQRIRSGIDFCAIANGFFSALAADGAKEATYCITRAMYAESDSPCFGSWLVAFIHDEFLGEAPEATAAEAAEEVMRIAQWVMQQYIPDVKIRCSIALMRRWRKGAKAYRDSAGRLQPYEDSPAFAQLVAEGKAYA